MLVYEFSQLTSSRGGQAIFTDIHLYWEVPAFLAGMPAVGSGGKPTGRTFGEYGEEARRFARALMAVYRMGDVEGKPFVFPRPVIHVTDAFFRTPGHGAFLAEACGVAAAKGNPCFILDRECGARISPCGGADFPEGTEGGGIEPWKRRCASIQNVTINLPRLGYRCGGDEGKLLSLLGEVMGLAAKAHVQKREFIENLLSLGDAGPLAMLAMQNDGSPYLRTADAACLIGMTGLDELVRIRRGKSLHESEDALDFGLTIVGRLREEADRLGGIHGMKFVLEQTPAETTAYRFARLDLKHFSPLSGRYVRGDLTRGEIYYTNSSHLPPAATVDPATRIRIEGRFHPLFRAGAVTHIELGEAEPPAALLADLVVWAFRETQNNQIVFSPEFTSCGRCGVTLRGLLEKCSHCGSADVDGLARITQYMSWVSGWNRGKSAELRDRNRNRDAFPTETLL
jgi:anaerobic ribonucleoside-triphosphate reductase